MRLFGFRLPFFVAVIWAGIGSTVWALGFNRGRYQTVYVGPVTTAVTVPTSYAVTSSWVQPTSYVFPTSYATAYVADPIAAVQTSYVGTAYYVKTGLFGRQRLVERPVYSSYASTYLPTSYYYPTSYYAPTSYYYPTTYFTPTSYYYPTTHYRTRSYIPTVLTDSVIWPSSYVASADCVLPETVVSSPPRSVGSTTAPRTGSRTVQSESVDDGAMRSDVDALPPERAPAAAPRLPANAGLGGQVAPNPQNASPLDDNTQTPPAVPKPQPPPDQQQGATQKSTAPANAAQAKTQGGAVGKQANPSTQGGVPQAPGAEPDDLGPPNNPPGGIRYQARRPVFPNPAIRPETRNVLFGTVQSRADGQPEEGVRVSVLNALDANRDKSTVTDAFGHFSMRLYDGDWTVNVTMPSGRVYPVSEIRVSGGQITDSQGRRVPSLEITR